MVSGADPGHIGLSIVRRREVGWLHEDRGGRMEEDICMLEELRHCSIYAGGGTGRGSLSLELRADGF